MRRLAEAGIHMNCQIVACPGLNDGPALARSMRDLTEMRNGVTSVAIVPVGLTKYRDGLYPLRSYTAAEAGAVIDQVEAWSEHCRTEYGEGMFWCSDEFYLIAGRPIPEDEFYEDYCQLENGVGMLRLLQVEFKGALMTMDEGIGQVKPLRHCHRYERWPSHHPAGEAGVAMPVGASSTMCTPSATTSSGTRSPFLV